TDGSEASTDALTQALLADEPEIALRQGAVLAPRLRDLGTDVAPLREPGEVRVAVHAAGLNFKDVVNALGLLGSDAPTLGLEGAGVVLDVAPDVAGVAPGDRVMGLIPDAFGPVAVTDSRLLTRIPDGWSFVQAASVPAVFLTAYYALVDLAQLQRGEAVLIHGAAGGVGMAALQLAEHIGAVPFATA